MKKLQIVICVNDTKNESTYEIKSSTVVVLMNYFIKSANIPKRPQNNFYFRYIDVYRRTYNIFVYIYEPAYSESMMNKYDLYIEKTRLLIIQKQYQKIL